MSEPTITDKMERIIEIRVEILKLQEELNKLNQEVGEEVKIRLEAEKQEPI